MIVNQESALLFEKSTWRLIISEPAVGAWNMAVDEAILESASRGEQPPTLRLYTWAPPCLSLGYAQPASDADLDALKAHGWHLVRRPTGGRAILHTDELTYSVCAGQGEPRLAGSVLESYRHIAKALLAALHDLGVPAQSSAGSQAAPGADPKGAVCFEVPSNYEITVGGKKLLGSAQARRKDGVLQHGSLPLSGDLTRITQSLRFKDEPSRQAAAGRLLSRATTVETALGYALPLEDYLRVFTDGFRNALNLELVPSSLTPAEQARATQLVSEKYSHPSWNLRL